MDKIIYDFLDRTVGHKVKCVKVSEKTGRKDYVIRSENRTVIVHFIDFVNTDRIALFCSPKLSDMVSGFFGISKDESIKYIRDWFGDVHGLKKVGDIRKFIPSYGE
jgi:hypothetical protein